MKVGHAIAIFRSFDEVKCREFYVEFLGFKVAFEHRFEDNTPLYMGLVLGETELHLSEHFGDGSPGGNIRIEIDDVHTYCRELNAKKYRNARPGVQKQEWGWDEMSINDPFGNKITFCQPHESMIEQRKKRPST